LSYVPGNLVVACPAICFTRGGIPPPVLLRAGQSTRSPS